MSTSTKCRSTVYFALACLGAFEAGCANLEVKKVPLAERTANVDHEQGFRYYLNRPYIVVKKPITISETISLVRVKGPDQLATKSSPKTDGNSTRQQTNPSHTGMETVQLTFITGPRAGQTVSVVDLILESPGTGAVRPMTSAELRRISTVLSPGNSYTTLDEEQTGSDVSGVNIGGTGFAGAGTGSADKSGATGSNDSSSNSASLDQPTLASIQHAPALVGDIGIIYLPDLDEQYVIKSRNCMSKTAFGLAFRNGSELAEVQGEHDSTALPLAILQQIQNAIATAQGVEQQRIQQQSKASKGTTGGGSAQAKLNGQTSDEVVWQLIERVSIKPGVYRLNKPWEVECGQTVQQTGCGLLAKLGLPSVVEVDFKPAATIGK